MSSTSAVSPDAALKFFNTVGKLKTLKRTGWVNHEVFEPESVADHMYRMSMLGFLITDPAVNKDRLIKVCLVHDLAESIVGDITPYDGVTKEQKRKLEQDAMKSILDDIGNTAVADELMGLWLEYEEGGSPEAHVARQLDKYEMIVQADEYEQAQGKTLNSFFTSTDGYFTHPEIAQWAAVLLERRNTRLLASSSSSSNSNSEGSEQQPSKKAKADHNDQ
jgi:putative hydrolase of HD superfamily